MSLFTQSCATRSTPRSSICQRASHGTGRASGGAPKSAPITVIDADVSVVTAAADKVLRIGEPNPWLLHFEFQASYDPTLSQRLLQYNVLLHVRHTLPVRSVAVLLSPKA